MSTNKYQRKIQELEDEIKLLKEKQIEIDKAKELYLKIFENFPALIWRSRLDKLCDYFNKTWLEFTGRTFEQEFGNGWAEGLHPDDFDFCVNTYVTAFDKREPFLMEYRLKDKSGEYRWIRDFGQPFYDLDNTFIGYIGSCYDITAIKDNEQKLIELNTTKDMFFSVLAHDLRNPFTHIIGLSELLMNNIDVYDKEKSKNFISHIYSSSINTFNLLENFLDWAKARLNKISFSKEIFVFSQIYKEVIDNLSIIAQNKGINIECQAEDELNINADVFMFKTILRNLLSNAIKFSCPNTVVKVSAEIKDKDILFTISDTGIGIPKELCNQLFSNNKVVPGVGTNNEKGTGLGLWLCKEFISQHGGTIWVESEVGKGSKFIFTIPCI